MLSTLQETNDASTWNQLAPMLDEAVSRLAKKDRDAVMLRFFKDKNLREVAAALNVNEAAAQRRVLRAVEKLRRFFTNRGVALSSVAIAGAISANSIQAAPVALAKSVTAVALAKGAAASGSTLTLIKGALKLMAWSKAKTAIVVGSIVLLSAGTTTTFMSVWANKPPPEPVYQNKTLRQWIAAHPPLPVISYDDIVAYRRTALLAMGNPAVRYLHWMIAHPQQMLGGYDSAIAHATQRRSRYMEPPPNFMDVVCALEYIGPKAAEAAPDLARLWESGGRPEYATYNGFPMALAELGDSSPQIMAALHRHFSSPNQLHAALSAFADWRLNPSDSEAANVVRRSLATNQVDSYVAYVLLDHLAKTGVKADPFMPEMQKLIDGSTTATEDNQATAAMAEWRLFHSSEWAIGVVRRLGEVATAHDAKPKGVNEFAAAALKLKEIPKARAVSMPILKQLLGFPDASAAKFCSDILDRLKATDGK